MPPATVCASSNLPCLRMTDASPQQNPPELGAESPSVFAVEARTVAPLLVGSMEAVARSRLHTVSVTSVLAEVAELLSSAQISVVVVCNGAGAPLGTLTETVLIQRLGWGLSDFFTTLAGDVMTREFVVCAPEDLLSDVMTMMHQRGLIHVLLVNAQGTLLGVVNARDGLRVLLAAGNHQEALLRNYVMGVGYQ